MNLPMTRAELEQRHLAEQFKYLLFWGHSESESSVTQACLSQWYPANFEINGINYKTAEHFMMAEKARLFNDDSTQNLIISCDHPGEAKKLGRKVSNFDDETWKQHRDQIVIQANLAKFSQNESLKAFLLNTANRILVEASPYDRIWGIGLSKDHKDSQNPKAWRGLNLLGFALMAVRNQIATN